MPPKAAIAKDTWSWVENVDPANITVDHVLTSYRLNGKRCKPRGCKRNCRLNPLCVSGMGEKVWEESSESDEEKDDPCQLLREPNTFVGLANLGATCYVNSLLQLWFHNRVFRQALYDWVPDYDPREQSNSPGADYIPSTSVGHLQQLFTFMQFTKRRCLDPTSFIASLGLDTSTQQDAQEFSKLFVSMLEERFSYQFNPSVSRVIQKQFKGEYDYVTRCCNCMKEFSCPSPFYELDLSLGTKTSITLSESLLEYLKEEKLEGTNKYYCSVCQSKQNATRSIRLKSLPPVLNIQLLRFVFDRKSEMKKKVNSSLHFPEVLDMESYVGRSDEGQSKIYDLRAVLIHRGPSAYSGHYIAQICDTETETWYRFNDKDVQKMEGKNFKLGAEDDAEVSATKKGRAAKTAKGMHSSCNAYMLVYYRRDPEPNSEERGSESTSLSSLAPWLQNAVKVDNENFEKSMEEKQQKKGEAARMTQTKKETMIRLLENLPHQSLEESELISYSWLTAWVTDDEKLGPVDNSGIVCRHGKVDPEKYKDFKCISTAVADELYAVRGGGGPRLKTLESVCWDCVRSKCAEIRLRLQIDADYKTISDLLKLKPEPSETSYWVGKESIRSWKRLAVERLFDQGSKMSEACQDEESAKEKLNGKDVQVQSSENDKDHEMENGHDGNNQSESNGATNSHFPTTPFQKEFLKSLQNSPELDSEELGFNDDILCEHRHLCIEESQRRLVTATVWELFRRYFPDAAQYRGIDRPCEICIEAASEEERSNQLKREVATVQKSALTDLFRNRNRPNLISDTFSELYIVTKDSIEEWRNFIREPTKRDRVTAIMNQTLLCKHGGLLQNLSAAHDLSDSKFVLLWPAEWSTIRKEMTVDVSIMIRKNTVDDKTVLTTEPAECQSCIASRLEEERRSQLHYSKAVVYIRQVNETGKTSTTTNGHDEPGSPDQLTTDPNEDPAFQIQQLQKKPRLDGPCLQQQQQQQTVNGSSSQLQARRSERQRKIRGAKEVIVSSDQTLRDLKVQVMKLYGIAPFDQHLTFNGRDLIDNAASLASLEIYPGSVINLKADEVLNDTAMIEDLANSAQPEEGFKGTELLRS